MPINRNQTLGLSTPSNLAGIAQSQTLSGAGAVTFNGGLVPNPGAPGQLLFYLPAMSAYVQSAVFV